MKYEFYGSTEAQTLGFSYMMLVNYFEIEQGNQERYVGLKNIP